MKLPPLSERTVPEPRDGSPMGLEDWLDRFSTELSRLRPHLGYTSASNIARILASQSRRQSPGELARLAAEELAFMAAVDEV